MQPSPNQYFRELNEEYFDKLENDGVDFLIREQADQNYTFLSIDPKYQLSADEMAREMGYESFMDYTQHKTAQSKNANTKLEIEQTFGRFTITYDGKELVVFDRMDDQRIILMTEIAPEAIEVMFTGVIETIKKHTKVKENL